MTPDDVLADRLARAFAPALFADSLDAWIAADGLVRDLPVDHPRRAAVMWRALELRTAFDPLGALTAIDREPPPPAADERWRRVPVAAMIAAGELGRAEAELLVAGDRGGAAWDTLRGQLALARGDLVAAAGHLTRARAAATDVEDRAHALLWSLDLAGRAGDGAAIAAHADALDRLLATAGAFTSRPMVALKARVAMLGEQQGMVLRALHASYAEEAAARLCEGVAEEQAQLGPIPRHVHAAFRKLRAEPLRLEAALLDIAGLQYRAGERGEAYATLAYAARLAPRLLGDAGAERLRASFARFREVIGAAQVAEHEAYLRQREDTFLRTMRR